MIGIGLAFFGISVDVLILFLEFHYVILFVGFIMPIVSVDFCKTWIGQSNKKNANPSPNQKHIEKSSRFMKSISILLHVKNNTIKGYGKNRN